MAPVVDTSLRLGLVGTGIALVKAIQALKAIPNAEITVVADASERSEGAKLALTLKLPLVKNAMEVFRTKANVVVEVSGDERQYERLLSIKPPGVEVMSVRGARLLLQLLTSGGAPGAEAVATPAQPEAAKAEAPNRLEPLMTAFGSALRKSGNPAEAAKTLLPVIVAAAGMDFGAIAVPKGTTVAWLVPPGKGDPLSLIPFDQLTQAAAQKEPVWLPRPAKALGTAGLLPLRVRDEMLGVLVVGRSPDRAAGADDPTVLRLAGDLLASALHTTRPLSAPVEVVREVVKEVSVQVPVEVVREVEVIKEMPVEVVKEVVKEIPVEIVREVTKEVPVEVIREVEVVKEVPVEVLKEVVKEVPVEVIREVVKEVPVDVIREVIREVPVEVLVEVVREVEVVKEVPVEVLVEVVREVEVVKEVVKEVPVDVVREVVKEVPVEVVKEVVKDVPVEIIREVVREVPVDVIREVIREVRVEVPVEVVREVEVVKEVVKEVPVDVVREVVKEVPVEVVKEVVKEVPVEIIREVVKEVPVEVVREVVKEVPVEVVREVTQVDEEEMRRLRRRIEELQTTQDQLTAMSSRVPVDEKMQALLNMASGVGHVFNNVLAGILGRTQLLLKKAEREKTKEFLAGLTEIESATRAGVEALTRIQEFSRARPTDSFPQVDLNDIVQRAVEQTRPKWRDEPAARGVVIDLITHVGARTPVMGAEPELLEALVQVIANAVDAMPRGGKLTIRTSSDSTRGILSVSDTGIGMQESVKRRAFEPFFSTKGETGLGLGLSVVYGILARHGGDVTVESEAGRGSTVTLRIPTGAEGVPAEPGVREAPRTHVLVVDDDETVRMTLADMLEGAGYAVALAASGLEGIARVREHQGPFDLVVTDLGMPDVPGWEVVEAVKQVDSATPVVIISGFDRQRAARRAKELKVDLVISKPFEVQEVLTSVRGLLLARKRP